MDEIKFSDECHEFITSQLNIL